MWPMMITAVVFSLMVSQLHAADAPGSEWRFVTVRKETAATSSVRMEGDTQILSLAGNGDLICDGRWVKRVALPGSPYIGLSAKYRAAEIEMPARNVIASLVWLDESGKETANPEYANTTEPADADGWRHVAGVFRVPEKAKQARIELRLRWSPHGRVEWRDARVDSAQAPVPRNVKVASINHRPRGNKTAMENLEQFAKLIDEAGKSKADIVCLPEAITLIGRGSDYLGNTEPIPGPSTDFLGQRAQRNHLYIVAGLLERDGKAAFNTAVLIGRDGKLIGKYRKICLPHPESDGGLAPGSETPVFETDFGKIGMMICWDVSYPEIARELAARGAEMILMPIWGGNETLCRARAIENQIPLVISSYDLRSAIYDPAGEPMAIAADTSSCVVYADLNLAETMDWEWTGHWRDRIWVEGPVRPRDQK
jgi:predicted amidohydrolase